MPVSIAKIHPILTYWNETSRDLTQLPTRFPQKPRAIDWCKSYLAVLRIGGDSSGEDTELRYFQDKGLPVYYKINQLPAEE